MSATNIPPPAPRSTPAGLQYLGPHTGSEPMVVTLVLRRKSGGAPAAVAWPQAPRWPRAQYGLHCGADSQDLQNLRAFAAGHGLTEAGADLTRRVLHLRGTPQSLEGAFAVTLGSYRCADGRGPLRNCPGGRVPAEALAVLGLTGAPCAGAIPPTARDPRRHLHAASTSGSRTSSPPAPMAR
jgi:kumamolisin